MKRADRKNGAAAIAEIARMRRTEKIAVGIGLVTVGIISLVLYLRYGWEALTFAFPVLALMLLPVMVFLRPKCPFCGVALTRNGEHETGTLFLPKCVKCGVRFDSPLEK